MATAIKYFDTAKMGYARITTGVTATDGSGASTAVTWYNTAPSTDYMLVKVVISSTNATGTSDPADSLFHIFVTDGTTERLIRSVDVGNPSAGTTSTSAGIWEVAFGPEFIFPSSVSLKFGISVTPTAGNVDFVIIAQAS
jgi:hypothetical protein